MIQRICDYCKVVINDGTEYLSITENPSCKLTHMCPMCWMSRGQEKGRRKKHANNNKV